MVPSGSFIKDCSVISRMSTLAGTPAAASAACTWSGRVGSLRCRADMFTATARCLPSSSHARAWRMAWPSTFQVRSRMRWLFSATVMKSSGKINPRLGCCHRTSASTLRTAPVSRSTLGWYRSTSWSPAMASRSSPSSEGEKLSTRRVVDAPTVSGCPWPCPAQARGWPAALRRGRHDPGTARRQRAPPGRRCHLRRRMAGSAARRSAAQPQPRPAGPRPCRPGRQC